MTWLVTNKFDARCAALADRHYSRRSHGSPQFAPPGKTLVLITPGADALWVTREERRDRTKHAWPGAWQNPIFRNEGKASSSALVRAAIVATVRAWGPPPLEGLVTFVDPRSVASRNPGYCFEKAGFRLVGKTVGGHGRNALLAFGISDVEMLAEALAAEERAA